MSRSLRWRVISVGLLVVVFSYLALANLVPEETRLESALLPDEGLRLGLDLQGGTYWVLSADLDAPVAHELEQIAATFRREVEEAELGSFRIAVEGLRLVAEPDNERQLAKVEALAREYEAVEVAARSPGRLELELTDLWRDDVRRRGMEQVQEVLRRRIDDPINGIQDTVVTRQGEDRIVVQIPGGQVSQETAETLLRQTGFLEFKLVLDTAPTPELLEANYPEGLPEGTTIVVQRDEETLDVISAFLVNRAAELTGDYLEDARVGRDRQQRPQVEFTFNTEGATRFAELTGENVGRQLGIILDDELYSRPVIRSRIARNGVIEGRFTAQEAADLAVVLRAGSLPIPTQIEENRTVGPALGADSIRSGTWASAIGLILIVVFTVVYYRLSGAFASFALVANLLLIIGIMSAFHATLTLPGIAGLVLTIGMAIDANVIIFERIREELRTGKTPRAAIDTGFSKALWTILDANITTLITAVILYEFGTGPIKGFALTLSIGILTSVFAALVLTRLLFTTLVSGRRLSELSIGPYEIVPAGSGFDFLGRWRVCAAGSAVILVAGLVAAAPQVKGVRQGIDFAGGTELQVSFAEAGVASEGRIRELVEGAGVGEASVIRIGAPEQSEYLIRFRSDAESEDRAFLAALYATLEENIGALDRDRVREEFVGPRVGAELRNAGAQALLTAALLILGYIAFRFSLRYAPGAIVALAHDVLVTCGLLVILGVEFDLKILAALLAILGYSLNDTIIVYDRIRENVSLRTAHDLREVVNRSVNQTLGRTLLTSTTTMLAVLSLLILGGEVIRSFAVAMTIGIVVGTYSSIYIAAPVLLLLERRFGAAGADKPRSAEKSRARSARKRTAQA